jgi:hypothetical protein
MNTKLYFDFLWHNHYTVQGIKLLLYKQQILYKPSFKSFHFCIHLLTKYRSGGHERSLHNNDNLRITSKVAHALLICF